MPQWEKRESQLATTKNPASMPIKAALGLLVKPKIAIRSGTVTMGM